MNDNFDLLNAIYQNAKTGEASITTLLSSIDQTNFSQDLYVQKDGYSKICGQAHQQIVSMNAQPEEVGTLSKANMYAGIKLNTLIDHTPSHVADMMIQGSTMGIVNITKMTKQCTGAGEPAKKLANQLVTFEQNNIERLKTYL